MNVVHERNIMENDELLTTDQVAAMVNVAPATLRWWRHNRTGPKGFRIGARKVMYKRSDVEAWLDRQYRNAESVN